MCLKINNGQTIVLYFKVMIGSRSNVTGPETVYHNTVSSVDLLFRPVHSVMV